MLWLVSTASAKLTLTLNLNEISQHEGWPIYYC